MPWISKSVRVVLPTAAVLELFRRAEQEAGGRYGRRGPAILVWSASPGEACEPQGDALFLCRTPTEHEATLYRIDWDPQRGGSEALVWEALGALAE